ncbi:hypothetical protein M9H77_21418 [Catharanthus roseus]|uniref:Uncharacterized protein n=1 Tax=Catharanthus roseus TaxID=4058 RepID=A0ACC0AMI4_CATRO|nr:hypothetical protein M9H77_21418 [Catharanthus roseus]
MGKKLSQAASTKISKPTTSTDHKKKLNNLIQVLRPKVYITDSSNFKNLVQQLTGNPSSSLISPNNPPPPSLPSPPPPPLPSIFIQDQVPIIEIVQDFDSSLDNSSSSETIFNVLETTTYSSSSSSSDQYYFPPNYYGEIESWLLQIDDDNDSSSGSYNYGSNINFPQVLT